MVKSLPPSLRRPIAKKKPTPPPFPPPPHLLAKKEGKTDGKNTWLFDLHFEQLKRMCAEPENYPDLFLQDFEAEAILPAEDSVSRWTAAKSAARPKA